METIQAIRSRLGLSQKALADLLGTTQATVSRWESGQSKPNRRDEIALRAVIASLDPGAAA